jgi:hypothetical protein
MDQKVRQRATRYLLVGLLQSDLSADDLQSLSIEFSHGTLGKELGELITDLMFVFDAIERPRAERNAPSSNVPASDFASLAYAIAVRRRLSKKAVFQLMNSVSPKIKPRIGGTLREMLESYFMKAIPEEADTFLQVLGGESADPYLRGISRRGQ